MNKTKKPGTGPQSHYTSPKLRIREVSLEENFLGSPGADIPALNNQTYDWQDSDWE